MDVIIQPVDDLLLGLMELGCPRANWEFVATRIVESPNPGA
jgi:hypothetical protein